MRGLRMLFIIMVVIVQFFASVVVTMASQQIFATLQTPQALAGLISGSASVILMIILMFGLFLPQFDRMTLYIQLMQRARDIVERAQSNDYIEPREFSDLRAMLDRQSMEVTRPSWRWQAAGHQQTGSHRARRNDY
jgi:hypothetical protein